MAVTEKNKSYVYHFKNWELVRDCIEGERAVKSRSTKYLPRLSGQSDADYNRYIETVHFFGATGRAADGLHGDVFSKPPMQTGNPPEVFNHMIEDVDLMGTSLDQFASDIVWDCMQTNWGGILVDYSKDADQVNRAQAENAGFGSFLKWYPAENVVNWKYGLKDGKNKLVRVVLTEEYSEEVLNDRFSEEEYIKYRVLEFDENGFYIQRVYDSKTGLNIASDEISPKINGRMLRDIPFYPCPGKIPEKSMLLDLAFENIGHYQDRADYKNGLHYTSIPTPIATGVNPPVDENGKPKDVSIGGTKFLFFQNDEGKTIEVKYLEFTGSGIEAMAKSIASDEERMAILGAHIITGEKKGVETAEAARIHRAGENGVLGAFVRNVSEQITKAMRLKAVWDGINETAMEDWQYILNTDYDLRKEDAQLLSVILQGRAANEFPRITSYRALKNLELIPEDWDNDTFLEETEKDASPPMPAIPPVEEDENEEEEDENELEEEEERE
jgi:hypothetical protein